MLFISSKTKTLGRLAVAGLALAGVGTALSSCKDYLDVDPIALNTTDATFATAAGSTTAIIGVYNMLAGDNSYGTRLSMYFPLDSDELIGSAGVIDGGRRSIARYKATSTNSEITNPWNRLYQGVERANICIVNLPTSPVYNNGTAADTATMHRLYGEALALRAQFYFELVRNWGDVPAQFTPTVTGQDVYLPNSDRNATLTTIIADLATAEKLLPWRSAAGYTNERFTKGAVKALRARIALQRGGYALQGTQMTRPSDYLDYYKIARQECLDILNHRSEHTLNSSFSEVFLSINQLRTESANEILLAVGAGGAASGTDSKLGYYNGPRLNASTTYGSTQGAVTLAPPLFYAFDSTDVRRDVSVTLYTIGSTNVQAGVTFANSTDGKFRRDWRTPALPGTSNYLGYIWPLIRFADVELMFAEAENEINGPTADAQKALLEVRTRGYGGNTARASANLTLTSKTSFFTALTNERYLELSGEGIRKYDLLRWNLLAAKLADVKTKIASISAGTVPYGTTQTSISIPTALYYKVVSGALQFQRSFYKPAPAAAPTGSTSIGWTSSITATYVANTQPAGSVYMGAASTGTGLAAEYVTGQGKELLPIPQSTIDTDPNLKQNTGY